MNKENLLWIAVVISLIGSSALAVLHWQQGQQIASISSSVASTADQLQKISDGLTKNTSKSGADAYRTIATASVNWNGDEFSFVHLCKGEEKHTEGATFCIGENRLALIDPYFSRTTILKTQTVTAAVDAPILLDAQLIPSSSKTTGIVLLSYTPEPCTTTGDCGAGMPTHYVTFAYDLSDIHFQPRPLSHYPGEGFETWNPSGTKAVFVPDNCGGAGCLADPLTGYDLLSDTVKTLTTETASGPNGGQPVFDASGAPLPVWTFIQWKDDTQFTATIFNVEKTTTKIQVKF